MLANLIISVLPLDINSHHLHCAPPCLSILYDEDGTMLSPVWSQFGANSGRISSIDTVAVTSSRNTFCVFILGYCGFFVDKFHPIKQGSCPVLR